MTKEEALKKYFGYDSFRAGQEALVDGILQGRDVCGIMPTGAGKSLCYQIPALLLPGITLVSYRCGCFCNCCASCLPAGRCQRGEAFSNEIWRRMPSAAAILTIISREGL